MISSHQERFVAECREQSVLDHRLAIGVPHSVTAEFGPSAAIYFDRKRRLGDYGRHWFPPASDRPFHKSRERMAA
jgi:hypothetical protein